MSMMSECIKLAQIKRITGRSSDFRNMKSHPVRSRIMESSLHRPRSMSLNTAC